MNIQQAREWHDKFFSKLHPLEKEQVLDLIKRLESKKKEAEGRKGGRE